MKKRLSCFAMAIVLGGALAACGGGGSEQAAPTVEPNGNTVDLTIEATDFQFNEKEYRVKTGDTVNVTFASKQGMHGIDIRGVNLKLKDGDSASFVAAPGEYEIICNIMCGTGHSQMKSTLIVE
ncbi:cytochrome C oxidase subunit II [Paenibacillus sp.]|uniref:cytochrome C oxidase subunit II n=1 Tax=Paenibacillus sp. TaxID=58172 RepID=UPI0028126DC0|nr:cytochrome C oxidase subunit II [Paenibacillus sp.]